MNTIWLQGYTNILLNFFSHILGFKEGFIKHLYPYLGVHEVLECLGPILIVDVYIAK